MKDLEDISTFLVGWLIEVKSYLELLFWILFMGKRGLLSKRNSNDDSLAPSVIQGSLHPLSNL